MENSRYWSFHFSFHIVGMAVVRLEGFEIDFARSPSSESAARVFVIILKFIFTSIFEIKIHEKNPWHEKNIFQGLFTLLFI